MSNVIPIRRSAAAELAQLAGEIPIATLQRTHLEAEELLQPWSASTLIAQLASATPAEREAILRQLEPSTRRATTLETKP